MGPTGGNRGPYADALSVEVCFLHGEVSFRRQTSARPVRFDRILVPLDGSELSEAILPLVNDLTIQLGASLVLQEVILPSTTFAGEYIPPTLSVAEPAASATNYLERIAQRTRELGISVDIEVGIGATAEAIRYVAEQTGADVIALGTHGRSAPLRWLLGSVADDLVRRSHLPCLILPARAIHRSRHSERSVEGQFVRGNSSVKQSATFSGSHQLRGGQNLVR